VGKNDPFQGFIGKPTYTIQFSWHQEAGIYRYCSLFGLLDQASLQLIWSELITFVSILKIFLTAWL
jgi:hypothetical protein